MLAALPQWATSILIQLCTGHVRLNIFLKKIGAAELALCPTCCSPETVTHFLLHCKQYNKGRCELRQAIGKAACSLPYLLNVPKNIIHTYTQIYWANQLLQRLQQHRTAMLSHPKCCHKIHMIIHPQ
jgi:hypothetical protein